MPTVPEFPESYIDRGRERADVLPFYRKCWEAFFGKLCPRAEVVCPVEQMPCHFMVNGVGVLFECFGARVRIHVSGNTIRNSSFGMHLDHPEKAVVAVLKRIETVLAADRGANEADHLRDVIEGRTGHRPWSVKLDKEGHVQSVTFGPGILRELGVSFKDRRPPRDETTDDSLWDHLVG